MNSFVEKAYALKEEIEKLLAIEAGLTKREERVKEKEEDMQTQYLSLAQQRKELAVFQATTQEKDRQLAVKEKQIIAKEKAILTTTDSLTLRLIEVKRKEQDVTNREARIAVTEKENILLQETLRKQKILQENEKELFILRKSKMNIKEEKLDREIERLERVHV